MQEEKVNMDTDNCIKSGAKTICVGLDGVIAQYRGWKGPDHIGEPMPGVKHFLYELTKDYNIIIHTTRQYPGVWDWLLKHQLRDYITGITSTKVPAVAYIDDKAVCFQGNFSEALTKIAFFSPWWKQTCSNCGYREGPVCRECKGENYGHITEAVPNATCGNWVAK